MSLRIREIRKRKRMTLQQLSALLEAEGIFLKKSELAHKERGEHGISLAQLRAIGKALDTPWQELANGETERLQAGEPTEEPTRV